ncbi:MAG: hypothetical protein NZ740_00375 [Kiritimatiellae bacterium]|nr:hypothetical protein [Kiritimatiellia bacterium]MDW8457544.1 hypothetical protein [Verrucomicrobiota bacterium]
MAMAQGFVLSAWALLLWAAFESRLVMVLPGFPIELPPSTVPGVVWLIAARRFRVAAGNAPDLNGAAQLFFIAALLHAYLIPYLGWWHTVHVPWFKGFNRFLLAISIGAGFVSLFQLASDCARRLDDKMLLAEIRIGAAAVPSLALLFAALIRWSAIRAGAPESGLIDWFETLRQAPHAPRLSAALVIVAPLSPAVLVLFELERRIRLHLAGHEHEKNDSPLPNQAG